MSQVDAERLLAALESCHKVLLSANKSYAMGIDDYLKQVEKIIAMAKGDA